MKRFRLNSEKRKNQFSYLLISLLPAIMVSFLLLINGHRLNWGILIPRWNDEVNGWWPQVRAVVEFGRPLGYYGYNETHAPVGTFGPWGVLPLLPYALFGKLFGMNMNSMTVANNAFLGLALFIFCLLTNASRREVKRLGVLYLCSYITVGYSLTSMSEGSRYAIGIILSGIIIWLQRNSLSIYELNRIRKVQYLLIIAFSLFAVNVYTIFVSAVFVMGFYMLRGLKTFNRILLSGAVTVIVAAIGFKLSALVSAPYMISTIGGLLNELKTEGIYNAGCSLINVFFSNMQTVSLPGILHQEDAGIQWFFLEYISIMAIFALRIVLRMRREEQHFLELRWMSRSDDLIPLYIMSAFLFGYCALYTGKPGTLCRGINTGLLMTFCYCAVQPKEEERAKKLTGNISCIILAFTLAGLVNIWNYHEAILHDRMMTARYISIIQEESALLNQVIKISPEKSEWENTIAHYGREDALYLAMPVGAGLNYMIDGNECEKSGYVVFEKACEEEEKERWTKQLLSKGYTMIYNDNFFSVYSKSEVEGKE